MVYRDLGGIKNKEDKIIKENFLIRSANFSKISRKKIKRLRERHLYKIIDLRTPEEIEEKPDKYILNTKYIQIPIFNEKTLGITREKDISIREMLKAMPDMEGLYRNMVTSDYSIGQLKRIIHEIVESEKFPIVFHCTAGKDRTGIIALIILSILDVSEEDIIRDYLFDNKKHKLKSNMLYLTLLIMTRDKTLASKVRNFYLADEKYLMSAIKAINEKYRSMDDFIRNELGVSDNNKEEFKKKVLREI